MGYLLRRQFDLTTLVIGFEVVGRRSMVRCALEQDRHGERSIAFEELFDPADLGLPERLDQSAILFQGHPFSMPATLLGRLREILDAHLLFGEALWLYLKRPIGYLAFAPWEQLLTPVLKRSVLRLPDFLVDPARAGGELTIVLCSSQPISEEAFLANEYLARITRIILDRATRRTTVHLFTDAGLVDSLKVRLQEYDVADSRVIVHDPQRAAPYAAPDRSSRISDRTGQLDSPWLLWMRDALAGRSVDLVHFVAHGYLAGESAALSVAESPLENYDIRLPRFIGVNEISAFLSQIGAWGCALTSPLRNYSEMSHRLFATTLANIRPGPLLHHEMRLDPSLDALAEAYALLLTDAASAPVSEAILLYCHPSRIRPPAQEGSAAIGDAMAASMINEVDETNRFVDELYIAEDVAPGWVSAAMRYIDQRTLEAAQQDVLPGQAISTSRMSSFDQSATLREIQRIVEDEARAEHSVRKGGAS
jgi:hypothetical protein